ncbi:unnamed protein product [Didymodactylos carnosus]|nr:unnamed protein product [Didymodactylos carnosus]CAF4197349.1 unnamed protein product [Didymodactylos carnosus]
MYSNYLTTETYERWGWSWTYILHPHYQQTTFRIVVQFNNCPLPPGHLLAFKAVLWGRNSVTKSSDCICLKEHLWLTSNMNVLDICSIQDLNQFINKDTLRIIIIVRHDWLLKKLNNEQQTLTTLLPLTPFKDYDCDTKLLSDMKSILEQSNTLSDIQIKINSTVYNCHRCILAARSPYFQTLFNGNFQESLSSQIDLSNFINETDFELLRAYLYKAQVNINDENCLQYFHLADKFLLDDLLKKCELFLLDEQTDRITEKNVFDILDLCSNIKMDESYSHLIKQKCFNLLKQNKHLINDQCQEVLRKNSQLTTDLLKYLI